MNKSLPLFSAAVIITLFASVSAESFPAYSDKYVNDFAGFFKANETAYLRALLSDLEQNTTAEVTVVTMQTTAPYAPSEYRTKLFNAWGIGKKDKDNGLLILYAVTEHRIEVEVGYGLEGILPDSKVGRLLDEYYVPLRDQNRTVGGIMSFTAQISSAIRSEYGSNTNSGGSDFVSVIIIIAMFSIFIAFFVILILSIKRGSRCGKSSWRKSGPGGFGGWSSSHRGNFGGGHHGGFGGGHSGGGGAGR